MAIGEHKNKSPYHGVFVAGTFMIIVPIVLYFVFRAAIFKFQPQLSYEANEASAKVIGFGVGVLFHLGCVIAGVLKDSFRIVTHRIGEFFGNLKFNFKLAWSIYVDDLRENGVAFWILFGLMVINFCFFWSGAKYYITQFFG